MLVLYPLGKGSRWNDNEILLSVKSLRKYTDVSEIWVTGEKPQSDVDVNYFYSKNKHRYVSQIVAQNLLNFIEAHNPKEFVLMNDDIFCCKPCKLSKLPLFYDKLITERMEKPGISTRYRLTLRNSIKDHLDLNFAVHFPMPIRHVELFKEALEETLYNQNGASYRNLYGNKVRHFEKVVQRDDAKYFRHMDKFDHVFENEWFSVGDAFLLPKVRYELFHRFY